MKKAMSEYYSPSDFTWIPWRNPATDSLTLTYTKNKSESFDVRFIRMDGETLSEPDHKRAAEIIDAVNTIKKRWMSDHWLWRFLINYKQNDDEDSTDEVFITCKENSTAMFTMYVYKDDKYGHRLANKAEMLLYQFSGLKTNDRGVLASFFQFWFEKSLNRTSLTVVFDHQL